jgi:hypothetical protein
MSWPQVEHSVLVEMLQLLVVIEIGSNLGQVLSIFEKEILLRQGEMASHTVVWIYRALHPGRSVVPLSKEIMLSSD